MVDCICEGDGGPEEDDASLCSSLLMEVSAELNALSSDELMVPADTSDVSSFCSMVKGDCCMPLSDDIDDMGLSLGFALGLALGHASTFDALKEADLQLMEPCPTGPNLFPCIADSNPETFRNKNSLTPCRPLALIQPGSVHAAHSFC